MQLPTISPDNKTRDFIDVFGGYNHNIRIGENEFYDMENLCSDSYPLLAVRKKRQNPEAFGDSTSTVGWVFTDNYYRLQHDATNNIITLYENILPIAVWSSNSGKVRNISVMGSNLVIIPDKKIVNPKTCDRSDPQDESILRKNVTNIENVVKAVGDVLVQPCLDDGTVLTIDYIGDTVPVAPIDGFVWLDTRVMPASLKKYYGSQATWQSFISSYIKITGLNGLSAASDTLTVSANAAVGATAVSFTGTVTAHALKNRKIKIGNDVYTVSDNTTTQITLSSGLVAAAAANDVIYPADFIGEGFKVGDGVLLGGFTGDELKDLNATMVVKGIADDNSYIIVTGSLKPVPDMNIITARETFIGTLDTDYFYFICDRELPAHYFKDKYIKIGDHEPWLCTDSYATAQNGQTVVVYKWQITDSVTDDIKYFQARRDESQNSNVIKLYGNFYATADPDENIYEGEPVAWASEFLNELVGKTVCLGESGQVATIQSVDMATPRTITLDKTVEVTAGAYIYGVEKVALDDKYVVGLSFENGSDKRIIVGEKSCPTLDTQYVQDYDSENSVKFSRKMPAMDFVIESQNRLWGCRYGKNNDKEFVNEIYCSKLGDPTNWQVYEGISTDSYAASCGTAGAWTGAFNYRGYPTFFKEHHIHTVYGSNPPYQIKDIEARGVQSGSSMSLAIVNEILFYKSDHGICAYTGNLPEEISAPLGNISYNEAIGCALDGKYYVEMKDPDNQRHLFVYDTATGMWHKESAINATYMAANNFAKNINYITTVNNLNNGTGRLFGSNESDIEWFAETGVYGLSTPDKKYICKLALRLLLPPGSFMFISIQYDSTGDWERIGNITGYSITPFSISIKPRRCDHFRIRLEGTGDMKLYSISKSLKQGSDR